MIIRDFIAGIPAKHINRAGRLFGNIAYSFDVRHRRIVRRNLKFAYPEWTWSHVQKTTRHVFQNLFITLFEIFQLACFSKEDILNRVKLQGEENIKEYMANPEGLVMISLHLGSWEFIPHFMTSYFNRTAASVARQVKPYILNTFIHRYRTSFGCEILYKKKIFPEMRKTVREGKILGIMIDQGTSLSKGMEVNFFGKTVTATPAAALLAMRHNCPVIPVFCKREDDASLTIVIDKPLKLQKTGNLRSDLHVNTQIMTSAIEKIIRDYPEQWLWMHKRWKRHYPQLYPEDIKKRRRHQKKNLRKRQQNRLKS